MGYVYIQKCAKPQTSPSTQHIYIMQDPFLEVKGDVLSSLQNATTLLTSFQRIYSTAPNPANSEELRWTKEELLSVLNSIDADLDDLDASVEAAQRDLAKFGLSKEETHDRKGLVTNLRTEVSEIRELVKNPKRAKTGGKEGGASSSKAKRSDRDALMERNQIAASPYRDVKEDYAQSAIETEEGRQKMLFQEQDIHLDQISGTLINMKTMASTIGTELEDQTTLITEMEDHVDRTSSRLKGAMKRIQYILKKEEESKSGYCILILIIILVVLLILVIAA